MEKLINNIIKKVQEMFRFDKRFKNLVNSDAEIILYQTNGELKLEKICFEDYDRLIVDSKQIVFYPELRGKEVIVEYDSWKDFLEL